MSEISEDTYEAWSRAGAEATRRGEFDAALDAYARARALASALDDEGREQAAALNVAMVRLQTDAWREADEGLREILLRTGDARIAYSAAYHLAGSLRRQSRHERAPSPRPTRHDAPRAGRRRIPGPRPTCSGTSTWAQSYDRGWNTGTP